MKTCPGIQVCKKWVALLAIPIAVLAAEGIGWWWMRPESDQAGARLVTYAFPVGRFGCVERPVEKRVSAMLHCDHGQTGLIQVGQGRMIDVNYFEWDQMDSTGLASASSHTPEVCMGNAGMKVERFLPSRQHHLGDMELVFDATLFRESSGGPLYIFKLAWAEGLGGMNLMRDGPTTQRYRSYQSKAVINRWRPRYARVLMIGVFGVNHEDEAWRLAKLNVLEDLQIAQLHPHR